MAVLKNGLLKRMAYVVGAVMAGVLHAEMTFSDLQSAIAAVEGKQEGRFIDVTAGMLTLDAGTELRNVWQSTPGSIRVMTTGRLVMNDGAVIRGFSNSLWGTAVMVGDNSSDGVFTMNGGLITECASTRSGTENPAA